MSIEAWADAARQDKYRQDAEHQRAIDTIQILLQGKIDSDSAAGTITSMYGSLLKCGPKVDLKTSPLTMFWGIFCDSVRALGGNREIAERLIGLINSISKLPDLTDEYGNAITARRWGSAGVYWRDLPDLAWMFREYAIGKFQAPCSGIRQIVLVV